MSSTARLSPDALEWLMTGATAVAGEHAVFQIEGPAAHDCLQGLVTCDVTRPGPGHLSYGAVLTPKGMIIADLWIFSEGSGLMVLAPAAAGAAIQEVFSKRIPPRLAKVVDQSAAWRSVWLIGEGVSATVQRAGWSWPSSEQGFVTTEDGTMLARLAPTGPAHGLMIGTPVAIEAALERFQNAGGLVGSDNHREAARILQGFPTLGGEIGGKTLPQEVRFDEVGGVSYTKGCYVGQETVARIHFRGHPNRTLRGLAWQGQPVEPGTTVREAGRDVGSVTSLLSVGDACLALTVLRHEVTSGGEVAVGEDIVARVIDPPGHGVLLDLLA